MAPQHLWIIAKCFALRGKPLKRKCSSSAISPVQPYFSQLPACEQTVWHDWPPLWALWSWLEGSPCLLWQKCYGNGRKVCTVAIALQERIAYYPPLCAGSNGEREGILSVMVMMHFKWSLPIIYQWMIMAREGEHPLGYSHDAREMVKRSVQRVPPWFRGDRLNEGAGAFLSLL